MANANNQFIGQSPRFVIEAIGMVLIAIIAVWLISQPHNNTMVISILGTLAFGAHRMLPALQQVFSSWSLIKGSSKSVKDVLELLKQPMPSLDQGIVPLPFNMYIRFKDINFRYGTELPLVLSGIDFQINKGSKVGIIGTTGSGKSTLIDILMGLLQPSNGSIEVDGNVVDAKNLRSWQLNIAHVPQSIYLSDNSIKENIAFGFSENKIDIERVRQAARQARLDDVIEAMPEQYETSVVGERGIRLSGGQRQRLGIADELVL